MWPNVATLGAPIEPAALSLAASLPKGIVSDLLGPDSLASY